MVLVAAAAVVVTAVAAVVWTSSRSRRKISYMLDALEDNEVNFRFKEKGVLDARFNRTLNRMKRIFEKEKQQMLEQEKYFGLMLDKVATGIMVVDNPDGHVAYSNTAALQILGVSSLVNLRQLSSISQELSNVFTMAARGRDGRLNFTNDMSSRTIAVKSSTAVIGGREMHIIVFNDISSEQNEIETESWTKLIRVLIHEIMNTVTPVVSLSDSLVRYSDELPREELRDGLTTIAASSKGLLKFVESYRNLMHVPEPVRKVVWLKDIMSRVTQLVEARLGESTALSYTELNDDIILYADEDQISQILVNLVKNAVQAGASRISVTASISEDGSTTVDVANDGAPVPEDRRERGQRRRPRSRRQARRDFRPVLHHQVRRLRHRPEFVPSDHAYAWRKPLPDPQRLPRDSLHADFPLIPLRTSRPAVRKSASEVPLRFIDVLRYAPDIVRSQPRTASLLSGNSVLRTVSGWGLHWFDLQSTAAAFCVSKILSQARARRALRGAPRSACPAAVVHDSRRRRVTYEQPVLRKRPCRRL